MGKTNQLGVLADVFTSDASNNVGIGGSPSGSYKLEVTGTGRFSGELSTTSGLLSISGAGGGPPTGGVGFRFVSNRLIVYGGSSDITFQKNSNAGANMTILESGNIGIGTSSPSTLLNVYTTTASDTNGFIQYENGNTGTGVATNAQLIGKSKYGTVQYMVWENLGCRIGMRSTANGGVGDVIFTSGTDSERMRITSGGNVGIGDNAPSAKLQINGGGTTSATNCVYFYDSAGTAIFTARNDSAIFFRGSYPFTTASGSNMWIDSSGVIQRNVSSIKYKTDVQDYDKGLTELMKLRPVSYLSKSEIDSPKRYAGMIAEELFELGFTEYVNLDENGEPDSISYASMVTILTKSIQELSQQNQDLKSRLDKAGL